MLETPDETDRLQRLLDRSAAGAGPHLRGIITEERRLTAAQLIERLPGMRLLVLAAALDVRVELRGYELKGVGDFAKVGPVCAEYGNGNDDDTIRACADMFSWLYGEGQKRARKIRHYAELGKAPENKVTPELAALPGSGLHPLIVFVDEIQELFLFGKLGKAAGETAEKCIKLFRALGIWLILGTKIPGEPYAVAQWRREHPGQDLPDGQIFTQPWPATGGPGSLSFSQRSPTR